MQEWKIAGSSIQGKDHIKNNIPCQDKIYSLNNENVAVISLADGAGSCKFSHLGAEISTRSVCELLFEKYDEIIKQDNETIKKAIIDHVIEELNVESQELNVESSEFCSTLLFVAHNGKNYLAGHIGDGCVGILTEDQVEILSNPDKGEFFNETYFIQLNGALRHLRIYKGDLKTISGFILISDGLAEGGLYDIMNKRLVPGTIKLMSLLDKYSILKVEEELCSILNEVSKKNTEDDCSIIILKLVDCNSFKIS